MAARARVGIEQVLHDASQRFAPGAPVAHGRTLQPASPHPFTVRDIEIGDGTVQAREELLLGSVARPDVFPATQTALAAAGRIVEKLVEGAGEFGEFPDGRAALGALNLASENRAAAMDNHR